MFCIQDLADTIINNNNSSPSISADLDEVICNDRILTQVCLNISKEDDTVNVNPKLNLTSQCHEELCPSLHDICNVSEFNTCNFNSKVT